MHGAYALLRQEFPTLATRHLTVRLIRRDTLDPGGAQTHRSFRNISSASINTRALVNKITTKTQETLNDTRNTIERSTLFSDLSNVS